MRGQPHRAVPAVTAHWNAEAEPLKLRREELSIEVQVVRDDGMPAKQVGDAPGQARERRRPPRLGRRDAVHALRPEVAVGLIRLTHSSTTRPRPSSRTTPTSTTRSCQLVRSPVASRSTQMTASRANLLRVRFAEDGAALDHVENRLVILDRIHAPTAMPAALTPPHRKGLSPVVVAHGRHSVATNAGNLGSGGRQVAVRNIHG
jgi:hypothetical protein